MKQQIKIFASEQQFYTNTAELLSELINRTIIEGNKCSMVLSGGSTPKNLYQILGDKYNKKIFWEKVFFYWGDERCVPPESVESNYKLAYDIFLSKINIPQKNIFRIFSELQHDVAAKNYEKKLRVLFKNRIPAFDILLLGLGEDGHTASLFKDSNALKEKEKWVKDNYVEKLNAWRITLTLPVINNSKNIIFLVRGNNKSFIVEKILADKNQFYPASFVKPKTGNVIWCLDKEAATLIKPPEFQH